MQFVAALIEYLITGLIALAWIVPLIDKLIFPVASIEVEKYKELLVLLCFPVVYVLGIYIDVLASHAFKYVKGLFKKASNEEDSYTRTAKILARGNDNLARSMETYVGRHRIARGVALNSLFGACTTVIVWPENWRSVLIGCVFMLGLSIYMEHRLRVLSDRFKKKAIDLLYVVKE